MGVPFLRKKEIEMTNEKKYAQVRKEAMYTGLALVFLILFWIVAGFGLAQVDVKVFHLPLWAVTSSVGVWAMAVLLVKFLTKYVFADMSLQDDEEVEQRG